MKYVNFAKKNGNLHITLTPEGKQEIQDAISDGKNIDSDDYFRELCEHPLCNGWSEVNPEDVAALTSSLIFSDELEWDDDGEILTVGRVYWFPNYQIESPVETLRANGWVVFQGAQ